MRLLATVLFSVVGSLAWAIPCSYTNFTPEFLHEKLIHSLNERGIAVVPAAKPISPESEEATKATSLNVIRNGGIVGNISLVISDRNLSKTLILTDNSGLEMLRVVEAKKGVERTEIEVFSDFQNYPKFPFLTIVRFPGWGVHHYVGVQDLGITSFYSEFRERWSVVKQTLFTSAEPLPVKHPSKMARFDFNCLTTPAIAPYRHLFSLEQTGTSYVLRGIVPSNFVYHRVLRLAQEEFGYGVRPALTIDQRLGLPYVPAPVCRNF